MSEGEGQLQNYSVDQAAGAVVLVLGAVASLLLVIWQSKCHCKINLCYIFQCERRPPNEDEMQNLKDQANKLKDKKNQKDQGKKEKLKTKLSNEPEPEPEPILPPQNP
tara:strand:+ start:555 stop:878 length:324 start_codon:yes stop_codon:yes gene_type:complete